MRKVVNLPQVVNTQMIEDYIKEHGLTKASFCGLCKIGRETFDRIFNGENFTVNALFKIAKVLNIQVHRLLIK